MNNEVGFTPHCQPVGRESAFIFKYLINPKGKLLRYSESER